MFQTRNFLADLLCLALWVLHTGELEGMYYTFVKALRGENIQGCLDFLCGPSPRVPNQEVLVSWATVKTRKPSNSSVPHGEKCACGSLGASLRPPAHLQSYTSAGKSLLRSLEMRQI